MKQDLLYSKLSKWYDEIYVDEEETKKEINFLDKIFKKHNIKSILDVACGSGRHTFELYKKGYKIDGFDLSKELLSIAKEKAKKFDAKINFHHGNMCDMKLKNKYDALICMFTSFNYLCKAEGQLSAFKNFNKVLKKNGLLIIDSAFFWNWIVTNTNKKKLNSTKKSKYKKLIIETKTNYNPVNNIFSDKSTYKGYKDDKLKIKAKENRDLSILTPEYLKLLCLTNGFEIVEFYTDFDLKEKLNKHSDKSKKRLSRLILVAKKVKK